MSNAITMLELVTVLAARATSDAEIVRTAIQLVNAGVVRLCGTFRGRTFDLDSILADDALAAR